ncbi:E1-E2 ATPase-domain-containing protein [Limtongia smithiae]|uniref:E1-E2 ATPase-domain-containing protein n=1 Tax=Limtongia smithiae TaxID=1125753 RepID=UPI0034CEB5E9
MTATTLLSIQGMTCGACTSAIENAVSNLPGVQSIAVSLVTERASVVHAEAIISSEAIREVIDDCGFDAQILSTQTSEAVSTETPIEISFIKVYGMTCSSCTNAVEGTLRAIPGVIEAVVALATEEAKVTYRPDQVGIRTIIDAITETGFDALLSDNTNSNMQLESLARTKDVKAWRRAAIQATCLAVPVLLINMVIPMLVEDICGDFTAVRIFVPGLHLRELLSLILTVPIVFVIGRRFHVAAFRSLKHNAPTMDVLVSISTLTAFVFSCFVMGASIMHHSMKPPNTIFETSAMIIAYITYGKYLENKAKGQTSAALSRLISLAPTTATIYVDPANVSVNPAERDIPSELIQVGDIVILRPGARAPADGVVVAGESYMDESLVTGEPMPVEKTVGSSVIGGTINGVGKLDVRVKKSGKDTQLSQIVNLVQDAQTTHAPIQRFADVVAGKFVPIVLSLAVLTFFVWMIVSHAMKNPPAIFNTSEGKFIVCLKLCISVIVVACPCALGLSTPTAVMVGTGIGAQNGILIKGGAVLERATHVTKVIFDKTGTLTLGKMSVISSYRTPEWDATGEKQELWWHLIRAVEIGSEHPIGRAAVAEADLWLRASMDSKSEVEGANAPARDAHHVINFEVVMGRGVRGIVQNGEGKYAMAVGNLNFMKECNVALPASVLRSAEAATSLQIFVGIDGAFAGTMFIDDIVRSEARGTILALQRMGIAVAMLTGDQRAPALRVAREIGIPDEEVWAGVLPAQKQEVVHKMQREQPEGGAVAMVGDGINDSPALASADIGIAMATGTDVAIEAAGIVLMRRDTLLMDVAVSLALCQSIFGRIKANLIWASVYNMAMIPFAMGIFVPWGLSLPPMAAGAAMAMSSVSVVVSSLMLKRWKRPYWSTAEGRLDINPFGTKYGSKSIWSALGRRLGISRGGNSYAQLNSSDSV